MKDYKDPTELLDEGFQSAREAREYWKALEDEEQAEYIEKFESEIIEKVESEIIEKVESEIIELADKALEQEPYELNPEADREESETETRRAGVAPDVLGGGQK